MGEFPHISEKKEQPETFPDLDLLGRDIRQALEEHRASKNAKNPPAGRGGISYGAS